MTAMTDNNLPTGDKARIEDLLRVDTDKVHTIIDESISMRGDIECAHADRTIVVAGKVVGTVRSAGRIVVTPSGVIEGSVRAPQVTLGGRISRRNEDDGVVVDGELTLAASARLECSTVYEQLHSEHGAVLAGLILPRDSSYCKDLQDAGKLPFIEQIQPLHEPAGRTEPVQRPHLTPVSGHGGTVTPLASVVLSDRREESAFQHQA